MKLPYRALILAAAAWPGLGQSGTCAAGGPEVAVYLVDKATCPPPSMYRATGEASEIFAGIGVRVEQQNLGNVKERAYQEHRGRDVAHALVRAVSSL
jgi:hypothetical protein